MLSALLAPFVFVLSLVEVVTEKISALAQSVDMSPFMSFLTTLLPIILFLSLIGLLVAVVAKQA